MRPTSPSQLRSLPARLLAALAASGLLAACVTDPARQSSSSQGEASLQSGIRHYESGEYELADGDLRRALELGLASPADTVKAHKHRAFILCTSGRTKACHDEFRKLLQINPGFELGKAEAGHPMWGPVFVQAKKENGKPPR